jgi:hypothetical protein
MSEYGYIQAAVVIISFLTSLTTYLSPVAILPLRMFAFFLFITVVVEFFGYYLLAHHHTNIELYNIFGVLEFSFYFWFLRMVIRNSVAKKIILYLLWVYPLFSLINIFLIQGVSSFATVTYSTGCLIIVIMTVYYFFELFMLPRGTHLFRDPVFWICFGLLLFYCCSFPIFGLSNFLAKATWFKPRFLGILLDLVNILLYSSFTIAFLCRIKMRKSIS